MLHSGYPRPIVGCKRRGSEAIDGRTPPVYLTEPFNVLLNNEPPIKHAEKALGAFDSLKIHHFEEGIGYFPSPGGVQEKITSLLVKIDPTDIKHPLNIQSQFSTSGVLRSIEAQQLLKAAQVGAIPETRLELNVYHLLLKKGVKPDPWIGEKIQLQEGPSFVAQSFQDLLKKPRREIFEPVEESADFLEVISSRFSEIDQNKREVAAQSLEFVVPRYYSYNTISIAVLRKYAGRVFIGIHDDNLPAIQCFEGASNLLVTPAWRLPKEVQGIQASRNWTCANLLKEYGIKTEGLWELGGHYHPSPGVTPEVVIPLAVEVKEELQGDCQLHWVALEDVIAHSEHILDGHLRTAAMRAAHALDLL